MRRYLAGALLAAMFVGLPLWAQEAMRFEVASVRPHAFAGDEASNRRMLPGGRFVARATTVRTLLRVAFGVDDRQITNAPKWVDAMFDVDAVTAGRVEVKTTEEFQGLMLSLLEERFGLRFHREEKQGPVYRLEMAKPGRPGPGLKASATDAVANVSSHTGGTRAELKVSRATMAEVAAALRRPAGRPVEDHMGLVGSYDFAIAWAPEETAESVDSSLFTVLKDQLGLLLRPAQGPVETVVIDGMERPAEN